MLCEQEHETLTVPGSHSRDSVDLFPPVRLLRGPACLHHHCVTRKLSKYGPHSRRSAGQCSLHGQVNSTRRLTMLTSRRRHRQQREAGRVNEASSIQDAFGEVAKMNRIRPQRVSWCPVSVFMSGVQTAPLLCTEDSSGLQEKYLCSVSYSRSSPFFPGNTFYVRE